jgi:hypothetical protein
MVIVVRGGAVGWGSALPVSEISTWSTFLGWGGGRWVVVNAAGT